MIAWIGSSEFAMPAVQEKFGNVVVLNPRSVATHELARSSVCVVNAPRLDAQWVDVITSLQDLATTPLVLVTDSEPDNTRLLAKVSVDAVVWSSTAVEELTAAIEEARQGTLAEALRRGLLLSTAARRDPFLIMRLSSLLQRREVPARVVDLAKVCFMSRSNLHRRTWAAFGPGVTPTDVLSWMRIAIAADLMNNGMSGPASAHAAHVDPSTLDRAAVRLTGRSFNNLVATSPLDSCSLIQN